MSKPLTAWDRAVYGAIAAMFGALLGLGAFLCLLVVMPSAPPFKWIVVASASFFFVVGVVRGPAAADLTGEAMAAVGGVAMAEAGMAPGAGSPANNPWAKWSSPVLLVTWLVLIGLLAWQLS